MGSLSFKENEMKQATANKLNKIERECIKIWHKARALNDIILDELETVGDTDLTQDIGTPLSNVMVIETVLQEIENFRNRDNATKEYFRA